MSQVSVEDSDIPPTPSYTESHTFFVTATSRKHHDSLCDMDFSQMGFDEESYYDPSMTGADYTATEYQYHDANEDDVEPLFDRQNTHPLLVAARQGSHRTIDDIMKTTPNANIEVTDALGWTPLIKAAVVGDVTTCELLVQKYDANIDHAAESGCTALHFAILREHEKVVKFLIEQGADLNRLDGMSGWTPLHSAIFKNNPKLIELLLSYGADPKIEDHGGSTAIDLTQSLAETCDPQIAEMLKAPSDFIKRKRTKRLGKKLGAQRDSLIVDQMSTDIDEIVTIQNAAKNMTLAEEKDASEDANSHLEDIIDNLKSTPEPPLITEVETETTPPPREITPPPSKKTKSKGATAKSTAKSATAKSGKAAKGKSKAAAAPKKSAAKKPAAAATGAKKGGKAKAKAVPASKGGKKKAAASKATGKGAKGKGKSKT